MKYRSSRINNDGSELMGCITVIIIASISAAINAVTFPYMINFWLEYAHKEPVVAWWHGILIGFVPGLGQLSIPGAVLTWIISLFL